jgi:putative tryptophan/tyrosine transport system substrate-binding protein
MRRREFITSLVSTITAWPFAGLAQTASKVYRIGVLSTDKPLPEPILGAIVRALARQGYVPDRNVKLELRASGDRWEKLPQLAKDLVASNVDVILTFSCPAAIAAKNATTTIPIVATESGGDPVATGLVKSMSRPSGNVTGVSDMAIELAPKRLEVLKDMVPTLRTVAMLWNVNDLGMRLRYQGAADAARTVGARVQPLGLRGPEDFDEASQVWCAIHPTQFSWSRMHSLASIADGSTNLLLNIGCRPPTSGRTMYAKAVCRPIAPTWMKFTIARPI